MTTNRTEERLLDMARELLVLARDAGGDLFELESIADQLANLNPSFREALALRLREPKRRALYELLG